MPNRLASSIGIDLGGADTEPLQLLKEIEETLPHTSLYLYAPQDKIEKPYRLSPSHRLILTPEEVVMEETPFAAIHHKKNASLMIGLKDLRSGVLSAFVSLANTGALVLASSFILGRMDEVHCPALVAHFPSPHREVAVLDLGASPQQTAVRIEEVVLLGAAYAKARFHSSYPVVGLLNIGHEEMKGTKTLQEVDSSLKTRGQKACRYVGFIEPIDIFKGRVDVAVTDGFTGNVLLKTAEGVYEFLKSFKTSFTLQSQAGLLLGVRGDVYKCHGRTSPSSLVKVIQALSEVSSSPFHLSFQKELSHIVKAW